MKREKFREAAHRAADWMADYLDDVGHRSVIPDVAPGEIAEKFALSAPEQPESFEQVFADFERDIMPGITHWNHPGWFGYFPANHSPPSIVAEMLVTAIGAQCMSWQTSPAATELEQVVMAWLREMIGLPDTFSGVIQDTASSGCLVALITARDRLSDGPGVADDLVVYSSSEAHSSIDKAVKLSGIGRLHKIAVDSAFAIDPVALEARIAEDLAAGLRPAAVVATIGTTSTGSVDDVAAVADICEKHGIWLHVDAAYAGSAAILPELQWIMRGTERADSFGFNPHKWLLTNFDCSAYYVRDPALLVDTFSTTPEYLRTAHDDEVVNFRDWGIPLGRRFRALKLWFVIRCYGVSGLQQLLRKHIELAGWLRDQIDAHPDLEVVGNAHFGLVCFRCASGDDATIALHTALNAHAEQYLTHTVVDGRYTIRASIGQWMTEREHVERLWSTMIERSE